MRTIEYLIISYSSLPLPRPRSYQLTKILKHLKGSFLLITSEYCRAKNLDFSLNSYIKNIEDNTLRVKDFSDSLAPSILFNLIPPLSQLPDKHLMWAPSVITLAKSLKKTIAPRVIIAFSRPETDLLIGIRLKKIFSVPLVVYFSDPWADKPYTHLARFMKRANSRLEAKVIKYADLILFTNEDQRKLVMQKYPEYIQEKARSIAHCYDETLYPCEPKKSDIFVVRHMGNFFSYRSPEPFIKAVHLLLKTHPDLEWQLLVEFYGQMPVEDRKLIKTLSMEHVIKIRASVPYLESLKLMSNSDLLLLIDTESEHNTFYNIFFPSKLVDYMGAKKNILAISSSNSPSANIINSYGGQTFSKNQVNDIAEYLLVTIKDCKPFQPNIRELRKYDAKTVATRLESLCSML